MNVNEAIQWVRQRRTSWQPTAKGYSTHVINANHVVSVLGDINIEDINADSYVVLQQSMLDQGKTNATVNRITAVLSVVINQLVRHRLLDDVVPFSNLPESKGRDKTYTPEQLSDLLTAIKQLTDFDKDVVFGLVWLASKTGAREGELLNLKWSAIDWDRDELIFYDTKVNGDDRVLPMTAEIRGFLKRLHRQRIDDHHVFLITKDTLLRRLRKAQELAGITDKTLCFHSLRHYSASQMFQRGASLPAVMAVHGWKRTETCQRYSHASDQMKREALSLM